jgi:hypothetical protein
VFRKLSGPAEHVRESMRIRVPITVLLPSNKLLDSRTCRIVVSCIVSGNTIQLMSKSATVKVTLQSTYLRRVAREYPHSLAQRKEVSREINSSVLTGEAVECEDCGLERPGRTLDFNPVASDS